MERMPCLLLYDRYTVEPLKRGHFGNSTTVLSSEVVLISEVFTFNIMGWNISNVVKFVYELAGPAEANID